MIVASGFFFCPSKNWMMSSKQLSSRS
jgi:hypothetical protein